MSMLFTVVIATFNRPHLLAEAIASVQAQTVSSLECVVVDDGSRTASSVIPSDDPRFRLIDLDTNLGLAHAWNTGIEAAEGDAVTFLDDDDLWTVDRLEHATEGLARADVAVCGARWLHRQDVVPSRRLEGDVHDEILDLFTPNMGRTAVRRSAMLPFDDRYRASQDVEWWLRQSAASEVATVDRLGHLSRRHDGVRSGNGAQARIASAQRMLTEHAPYFSTHPRARAFRYYRIGEFQATLGDRADARRSWLTSLRAHPSVRAARALATSVLPPNLANRATAT